MKSITDRERYQTCAILFCCIALALGSNACGSSDDDAAPATPGATGGTSASASGGTGGGSSPVGGSGGSTGAAIATGGTTASSSGGTTGGSGGTTGGSGGSISVGGSGGAPSVEPGSSDWPFIGYDIGSTYFNKNETVLTKANAATLTEKWTKDLGGAVMGAPLQIGDTIYASGPGVVKAYEAASGNELWSTNVGSTASLGYADGKLYVHTNAGAVTALDAMNGDELWSEDPNPAEGNDGSSSPIVVGDAVLIGGANGGIELTGGTFRGYLSAMNRMTGAVLWTTYTVPESAKGASIWSSPSADLMAGRAYAGTGNNYGSPATDSSDSIISFDLASGEIKWKAQRVENDTFGGLIGAGPDADFGANPVLYETMVDGAMTQLVSAGNKGGDAHAVRRDTGELVWTRNLGNGQADGSQGVFVNSTWGGKNMLFACNEGGPATLYALDGATGDVVWMRSLTAQVWGRMSAINGVGFVGTGTEMQVFDLDTGDVIKSFQSKGGTVAGTITISKGRVAFGEGFNWSSGRAGSTLTVLALP